MTSSGTLDRLGVPAPILPPGGYVIAVDSPLRTYLVYDVVTSGTWSPEVDGYPQMQQWLADGGPGITGTPEYPLTYTDVRMQAFTPGSALSTAQIQFLLPLTKPAPTTIRITDPPYSALPAPADSTAAIQAALNAAGLLASPLSFVDVLVPAGTWNYSGTLLVPANVRLRGQGMGVSNLNSTNQNATSVILTGSQAGALFLTILCNGTSRSSSSNASGVVVNGSPFNPQISNTLVVGVEVSSPRSAHLFVSNGTLGMEAFNYCHDGWSDTYHHTGKTSFTQCVANRSFWPAISHGDDMYAFVSEQTDLDLTHHCTCIANWGRNGPARQLSCVGGAFIDFEWNDTAFSTAAGGYIAQEIAFATYGVLNCTMKFNTIDHANINLSHAGILGFSSQPTLSAPSASFGTVSNQILHTVLFGNTVTNTQPGIGQGQGIELRTPCLGDEVVLNNVQIGPGGGIVIQSPASFIIAGNNVFP